MWRYFKRSSARITVRFPFSPGYYKPPMTARCTHLPLRRPFLGSIRSGIRCAPIPLFKNSARKSSREPARFRSAVDSQGQAIWIADAHRDGKRFVAHGEELLTAFLELDSAIRPAGELS